MNILDETDVNFWIDRWRVVIGMQSFAQNKNPACTLLAKVLLSIISGPLAESSFNSMDNIKEQDRSRMTSYNYEAHALE